jgi:RNA polymerase sigma-70 factor (ECF subfamily)
MPAASICPCGAFRGSCIRVEVNILGVPVSKPAMSDPWDESQLVDRLRKKDEAAFAILVRRFQARLYGLAFAMTLDREESRDIVQEVFLKAYRSIGTFRGDSKLSTWLHRITVNQCLNWKRRWLRRLHRQRPLAEEGDEPSAATLPDERTPEAWLREKQLRRHYLQALQALPDKARAVYVLKELEGRSYDEIAATLRLNRGTVSSRLHYARKQLQSALEDFQDGDGS